MGFTENAAGQRIEVDGEGSELNGNGGNVFLGYNSPGNVIEISDGGTLRVEGNNHLTVGYSGSSTDNRITVANGGRLLTQQLRLGRLSGADGQSLIVTGAGSTWTNHGLRAWIGRASGNNQLIVKDGAEAYVDSPLYLSVNEGTNNTILLDGGNMAVSGPFYIGYDYENESGADGNGSLIITGGARLQTGGLYMGEQGNAHDNLIAVSGAGTVWTDTNRVVIGGGTGNLMRIEEGALVRGADLLVNTNGRMHLSGGGKLKYERLRIERDAVLSGSGILEQDASGGHAAVVAGILSPGESIGEITFTGGMVFEATAEAVMEIGGADVYDRIVAGDLLVHDGTLRVTLVNGYEPGYGDAFHLFDATSHAGASQTMDLPPLSTGLAWDAETLNSDGWLRVTIDRTDTDGDGIPDWWEEKYFSGPTSAVAGEPSDQSGFTNLEKFVAGLEPFNDDSVFVLGRETGIDGQSVVLCWSSVEGRIYAVDIAAEPGAVNAFTPLDEAQHLPATPPLNAYTNRLDESAPHTRFYRIRVRLPAGPDPE